MRAGQLTNLLTIQSASESRDGSGGVQVNWTPVGQVWADIRGLSGREFLASQQAGALTTHEVRIRYYPGLSSSRFRFVWDGKILHIEAIIDPDGRRRDMICRCIEVTA